MHVGDADHKDGPLRRMWTVAELGQLGIPAVAKAHFLPFVPETESTFGSMTLNASFDPERVATVAREMSKPWIIWGPTLNAVAHHEVVKHDDAWKKLFEGIELAEALPIVDEEDGVSTQFQELLSAIATAGAIFATGHVSAHEVMKVVPIALQQGVKKIVLTHVSSRHNRLTVEQQEKLFRDGDFFDAEVFAEHCAITWFDGKVGAYDFSQDFAQPIARINPARVLITSDTGRYVAPEQQGDRPISPQECLLKFCSLLVEAGVAIDTISQSLINNPSQLLKVKN